MRARQGFALLAVLWVIVALSAIVGLGLGALRVDAGASINRLQLARGRWGAEACLAIAEARWAGRRFADTATVDLGRGTWCAWSTEDPTARVNVNLASRDILTSLSLELHQGAGTADSLITARPFQDTAQVRALLGSDSALFPYLTIDGPGTVDLNRAPLPVVLAIPGLGLDAAERLADYQRLGQPLSSLDQVASVLSGGRSDLLAHYADLSAFVTFSPPQLRITATGWVGDGGNVGLHATIEELAVPLPERLAVIRRRVW